MIKVNVVAVGKVKEKYFADGIAEYVKRLSRYCDFSLTEVKEENFTVCTPQLIETIKEREAVRIEPHLKGAVYALAIEGKKLSSERFAAEIEKAAAKSGVLTFVIGGSYGIADRIKEKAALISFSDMTFPHTLFRLMLTEQIYRAFSIIAGTPYHK